MTRAGDTIFALSSGAPPAAIAVVRVSGPRAGEALAALAGRLPAPRRATLAALHDGDGALLDRALLLWFPGPASATGEHLAELHLHGGRAVVASVLAALGRLAGLRPAIAGEFTRRAFDHGRIDLLEAQGLADLLAAETDAERRRALHAAEGGLSRLVEAWREALLGLAARAEAQIEYGDGEDDVLADPALGEEIGALAGEIRAVLAHPPAERLRDGLRVVLAGPPNSGKSTLLNALAAREVAITSPVPGTTRDLIEAPLQLGGTAFILIDSAGIRHVDDPVEREGVVRAEAAIARADMLLWLGDVAAAPQHPCRIQVANKSDLTSAREGLPVSALLRTGIEDLIAAMQHAAGKLLPRQDGPSLLAEQRALLRECAEFLDTVDNDGDMLLRAEHLNLARAAIDRLLGRAGVEEMLDRLFGRFCIGK